MPDQTIRCPGCGRRAPASATVCPDCRGSLQQLCACGATAHLADATCAACGAVLDAPTYRRRPVALRIVAIVVLVGLVATAGAAFWNARQRNERKAEIWRLSDEAFAAVKDGRYAEALPLLERYVASRPRDAQMLYLLAVTQRQLDAADPLAGVRAAQTALEVDGSFSEAASLLAVAYDAAGDVDRALGFARRAVAGSRPSGADYRLLASLEARSSPPDLDAAVAALERARALAPDDRRLTVFLAMLQVRRLGATRMDEIPDDLMGLVAKAENVVFAADDELRSDPLIGLAEIELSLLRGAAAPARRLAERMAKDASDDSDTAVRARLLLGRAALREGDRSAAHVAFAEALRRAPTAATALEVAAAHRADGSLPDAILLLAEASSLPDAAPGLRDVQASLLAASGDSDAAVALLQATADGAPPDGARLVRIGNVQLAAGDLDAADRAYAAAEETSSPLARTATLRRAVVALSRPGSAAERLTRAREVRARLDARLGDPATWSDPAELDVRGRVELLAGRVDAARALLQRALDAAPRSAPVRLSLAEAEFASGTEEAAQRGAALVREALELAPHEEPVVTRGARLLIATGDARQAHAACQRFLDRMGDRPGVLDVAAEALGRLGRWEDAADRLARLRALGAPGSSDALHRQVDSLLRAGAAENARRLVAEADPEGNDEALANLLATHGATPEQRLERLRREGPGLELALALLSRGRTEEALGVLRSALELDPADEAVRRALVLLLLDAPEGPGADARAEARRLAEGTPDGTDPGVRATIAAAVELADGHVEAARRVLDEALQVAPDDPFVVFFSGRALFEGGERRAALGRLRRAVALPGALPGFGSVLSQCLHAVARESTDAAVREALLWEALLHDTWNVGATVDLANLLFETGRPEESARLARRLVAGAELPAGVAEQLRRLAMAGSLRSAGMGELLAMVDDFPFDDQAAADRLLDGLLLLRGGREAQAAPLLERVREAHPGSAIATIAVIEAYVRTDRLDDARGVAAEADASADDGAPPSRFRRALIAALLRTRRHSEALAEADALAAAEAPDEELAEAIVTAALALGDPQRALAAVDDAAPRAERPAAVRLALLRAAVLRESGSPEEALRAVEELQASVGGDPELGVRAAVARAQALLRLGRFDDVEALEGSLDGVRDLTGRHAAVVAARAAFVRGSLAMVRGRTEDAVRWLRTSLQLDPSEPAAANNLAWILSNRPSRADEALRLARAATDADPRNPEFWDTRGACARLAGRADEAEEAWATALRLAGPPAERPSALHVEVWTALAELLADEGRFEEAAAHARRVLASGPAPEQRDRARAVLRLD